jgi:hypothetical protein
MVGSVSVMVFVSFVVVDYPILGCRTEKPAQAMPRAVKVDLQGVAKAWWQGMSDVWISSLPCL